jgi:hypothetical protein
MTGSVLHSRQQRKDKADCSIIIFIRGDSSIQRPTKARIAAATREVIRQTNQQTLLAMGQRTAQAGRYQDRSLAYHIKRALTSHYTTMSNLCMIH